MLNSCKFQWLGVFFFFFSNGIFVEYFVHLLSFGLILLLFRLFLLLFKLIFIVVIWTFIYLFGYLNSNHERKYFQQMSNDMERTNFTTS